MWLRKGSNSVRIGTPRLLRLARHEIEEKRKISAIKVVVVDRSSSLHKPPELLAIEVRMHVHNGRFLNDARNNCTELLQRNGLGRAIHQFQISR